MIKRLAVSGTLIFVCIFVLSLGANIAIHAQSAEPPADDIIKSNCSSSQFALQQIEKRDAVSRINRGRAYDQMLRQASAFNSRFAYNKTSSPDLIQLTSDLQAAVDTFRANYDKYDTDLSDAQKIDCKQKPVDYYNMIVTARNDRNSVGDQVDKIVDLMRQYRAAIVGYEDKVQ